MEAGSLRCSIDHCKHPVIGWVAIDEPASNDLHFRSTNKMNDGMGMNIFLNWEL